MDDAKQYVVEEDEHGWLHVCVLVDDKPVPVPEAPLFMSISAA